MKVPTKLRFILTGSLLLLTPAFAISGQLVYFDENGGNGNPRGLYNFDPTTGISTLRAAVPGDERWFSFDQRPSDGTVFAAQLGPGDELWSIDPDTGALISGVAHNLPRVADISIHPVTEELYALGRNAPFYLHTIDPLTGAAQFIGAVNNGVRLGLTFSPSGVLYGFTLSGDLYSIDPTTAGTTLVGGSGATFNLIEDADFDENGELYIVDWFGLIGHVDKTTGFRTLLGNTGMGDKLTGLVSIAPPAPFAEPFCFGDGIGASCPCGNFGATGEGCANSTGFGAMLTASGSASVTSDDITFQLVQGPAGVPAICFVGTLRANGGLGDIFGDGFLCATGVISRLGVQFLDATGSGSWGPGLAAQGGWSAAETRHVQGWYRNSNSSLCGSGFNTTHGLTVVFQP